MIKLPALPKKDDLQLSDEVTSPYDQLSNQAEADVGTETTSVHILFSSKLGWIYWKVCKFYPKHKLTQTQDTEASLYALFEKAFAATVCALKFGDTMDQFALEVNIPNTQVSSLEKELKGKGLMQEIGTNYNLFEH